MDFSMASTASAVLSRHEPAWTSIGSLERDYFSHGIGRHATTTHDSDNVALPVGFPSYIDSATAWIGKDFESDSSHDSYTSSLNPAEVEELEQACHSFKELGLAFENISQDTFPLPSLGDKLKALASTLTCGVGFFRICGLDSHRYSNEMNVILYLGISSYIGQKHGRQDELGNMLLHLTDLGSEIAPESERQAPYSNVGQSFHTDVGDIIALYSLGEAECGGENQLVSAATIYNELVKSNPDIIHLLSSPSWIFDSFGQEPSYSVRPILYPMNNDRALFAFSRRPLVGNASSPRSYNIPNLSPSHVDAINLIQSIAEKNALSLRLKPGDLLFWNNLSLLHSRRGFTDSPARRRHLLRLWLRNQETERNWTIPTGLQTAWSDAFEHAGRPQLWPIEPIRDRDYVINQQRSSGHD